MDVTQLDSIDERIAKHCVHCERDMGKYIGDCIGKPHYACQHCGFDWSIDHVVED